MTPIAAWEVRPNGSPNERECASRFVQSYNVCLETYETMHNSRNDVWWNYRADLPAHLLRRRAKANPKRTTLGRVNFAPRVGALRNGQG